MSSKRTEVPVQAEIFGRAVRLLLGHNASFNVPANIWRVSADGSPSDGGHYLHNSCLAKHAHWATEHVSMGAERPHRSMDLT